MKFKPRSEMLPSTSHRLPSRFAFGDPVVVYFGTAGIIQNCSVIKIHFTESKVFYDVEVKWKHLESADNYSVGVDTERELTDRLYNLDSGVVFSPDDFEDLGENQMSENLPISFLKYGVDHFVSCGPEDRPYISKNINLQDKYKQFLSQLVVENHKTRINNGKQNK